MNADQVFDVICEQVFEVLYELEEQGVTIKKTDSLASLGANSVDRSEILMMTLEALDLNIPLVETFGPTNIGELAEHLAAKL